MNYNIRLSSNQIAVLMHALSNSSQAPIPETEADPDSCSNDLLIKMFGDVLQTPTNSDNHIFSFVL